MIKNECKIVRDLFPNYIEKQISNETKEFVDNHLKECSECSKLLSDIKSENIDSPSQKKEIDFLKIYNIQMFIAKVIIAILLCIIISAGSIVGYRFIKGAKAYNIIAEVSAKKDEFFKSNNFIIKENDLTRTRTLSVYDNYFKEEVAHKDEVTNNDTNFRDYTNYGKPFSDNETVHIHVNEDNKIISSISVDHGKYAEYTYNMILSQLNTILTRNKMNCYTINVTEEKVKDINCYVLEESNRYCTSKWYIDTSTMLMIKFEKLGLDGSIQRNIDYSYSIGTVKEDEIVLTKKDGKLIVNGAQYEYDFGDKILAEYFK